MSLQLQGDEEEQEYHLLLNNHPDVILPMSETASQALHESTKVTLTFKNITYSTYGDKGVLRDILNNISGYVRSGELLAILGPSGAGKSTLLDILAQRPKSGKVKGEVLLNGKSIDKSAFRRISAYVQQEDLLQSYLTVRESIYYAAQLRTPPTITKQQLQDRTQRIMSLLRIDNVKDAKIGSEFVRGISGGEKKRCAIAIEFVSSPSLLFLDEPTTGLDTFTALHLLTILKDLAAAGVAVIFSIHQPRSSIFTLFDQVLLLTGQGEEAYFGPAQEAMNFLARVGIIPNLPENPADFLIDAVATNEEIAEIENEEWARRYHITPMQTGTTIAAVFRTQLLEEVEKEINTMNDSLQKNCEEGELYSMHSPYFRGIFTQIRVVATRALLNKIRDPIATFVMIVAAIFFAVLIGSVYFHLGLEPESIRNRMGVLFFVIMNTAFSSLGSLSVLMVDRAIFIREHRNGMYRSSAYFIGKIIQDVPLSVLTNLVFDTVVYFMVGLQPRVDKFFCFYLVCTITMLNSYSLCLFISNLSKNMQVANIIAPLVLVLYLLPSGGILMNVDSLPIIWRWMKYVSFVRYGLAALVVNEFEGLSFNCPPDTPMCVRDGTTYAASEGFLVNEFWQYVGASTGSICVYMILAYIALVLLRTSEGK